MNPTYQLFPFSGSTNFLPISISSILSSSPDTIHLASSTNFDEMWLDAYNYSADDGLLTICLGGTNTHQRMQVPVPTGRGLIPIIKGLKFTGGVTISAFASSANIISVVGFINRIVFV